MRKAIVIVEAISTGLFYEQDILDRGYLPLLIYPYIQGSQEEKRAYENVREACRKQLSEQTVLIADDGNPDHLLAALSPYEIVCVLAGSEMGVVLADWLAQKLRLPGNPPSSSLLHLDKDLMQQALQAHHLRSIRGKVVRTLQEVRDWWEELSVSHVVLKHVAGAGTAGLHYCSSLEEALRAAEEEFSRTDYFGRQADGLIMQERVEGTEYIVNTVSCGGVHRVTDIWVYDKVRRAQSGNAYNYARILRRLEAGHAQMVEYAFQVLDALALINLGMPVILIYAVIYSLIGIGGSSQYAVLLGEGRRADAKRVFSVSLYAMTGISLVLLFFGLLFSGPLSGVLTDDASLRLPLEGFLRAQFLSAPIMIISIGLSYFVTNEGHPNVATVVFAVANYLNIVMDYVYILFFHMGVEGTAYATATGYAVGLLIELFVIRFSGTGLRLTAVGTEDVKKLPGFCLRGIGSAFNQFGFVFRYVVINALVQALAGSLGLVVFSLCMQTFSFISLFVAGVVQTMIPIVAVLCGEQDQAGIRFIIRQSNRFLFLFTVLALVLFEVFPGLILLAYGITDAEEAAEALWAIRIFSLGYLLRNLEISIMMYLQTIGEKKEPVLISFLDAIVLGGVCLILGGLFGIRGVWAAFPLNSVLVMVIILLCSHRRAQQQGGRSFVLYPLPPQEVSPFLM